MKQSKAQSSPIPKRKHRFNIMIDEILPRNCQQDLWECISSSTPNEFLAMQQDIMNILMGDQKLFESFFKRFYLNHLQLHNWYMLAKENQLELKKYVFAHLLDKTYRQYREIIKDEQIRNKFAKMNQVFRTQDPCTPKEKKKECFHKILLGNCKIEKPLNNYSSLCDEEKERKKQQQFQNTLEEFSREDYHELFLKTFNACDGSKYIYYDFDKHMRGIDQQKNYNNFIRVKKHARLHNSLTIKEEDDINCKSSILAKENSHSTYITAPDSTYFHQSEEKMEKMVYCNYNWNPIGSVDTNVQGRQQHILKKLPNVFKKVKPNYQSAKVFLLRKKKKVI